MSFIQDSERRNLALAVVAIIAGAYVLNGQLYAPVAARAATLEQRLERLGDAAGAVDPAASAKLDELRKRTAAHQYNARRLEALLPAERQLREILQSISTQERRARVELAALRPEDARDGNDYRRWGYQVEVVGEYRRVGDFLAGISSLSHIVAVDAISLAPDPEGGSGAVHARLDVWTLVKSPEPGDRAIRLSDAPEGSGDLTRFAREVFTFPPSIPRSPFAPPEDGFESGPRFEALRLIGIVQAKGGSAGVALFRANGANEPDAPRIYRAGPGDQVGNCTILELRRDHVLLDVTEFGVATTRVLHLPAPGKEESHE